MIPLHFGRRERLLFGLYTPAAERRKRRGVIICNPWGGEALRAHRSLRFLGELLAQSGLDVLRFDYSGTGDSFGAEDAVRMEHWIDDTEFAIDELMSASGVSRVSLVGLRLGSYVAAAAAARRSDVVDRAVLWEPMVEGRRYLQEMLAEPIISRADGGPLGTTEVSGFPMTADFRGDVERCSLAGLPGPQVRVLLLHSSDAAPPAPAEMAGKEVSVLGVEAAPCWVEEQNSGAGALPVVLLRKVTEWLS
jgi:pimeloyl-ACP methyl ester carboxylesterase